MNKIGAILKAELRIADIILMIIVIAAIVYSSWWALHSSAKQKVFIYKDNELWGIYELDRDREIIIDVHNRVQIAHGKVRMSYADCPGQRCVKQGYTSSLPIICLPNRVTVEVSDNEKHHRLILH